MVLVALVVCKLFQRGGIPEVFYEEMYQVKNISHDTISKVQNLESEYSNCIGIDNKSDLYLNICVSAG